MADVYVSEVGVPRRPRNKRIYGGVSFNSTNNYDRTNNIAPQRHIEAGRILYKTGDSYTLTINFTEEFDVVPIMMQLKLYRMAQLLDSKWVMQDVLFYANSEDFVTETGFEIVVDAEEDIDGVILNYSFTE